MFLSLFNILQCSQDSIKTVKGKKECPICRAMSSLPLKSNLALRNIADQVVLGLSYCYYYGVASFGGMEIHMQELKFVKFKILSFNTYFIDVVVFRKEPISPLCIYCFFISEVRMLIFNSDIFNHSPGSRRWIGVMFICL